MAVPFSDTIIYDNDTAIPSLNYSGKSTIKKIFGKLLRHGLSTIY
jgi:hypothetical protein